MTARNWVKSRRSLKLRIECLEGRVLLASDLLGTSAVVPGSFPDAPGPSHGGPEVAIPLLHSNPTATKKIFLDFDGHVVSGTPWDANYNNGNPIHAPAYSIDADIFNFTQNEINRIVDIWNRTAEDYAPFQVDVTTEDPGAAAFTAGSQAIRALVSTDVDSTEVGGTGNQWFSGAGGVAYLNSWTNTTATPVWIFENNLGNGTAKYVAEAISHEVGHAMNLSHDGVSGGASYYEGHGSGATGWAPIMGVGYYQNLTQWSRGEYPNANQTQNDLTIISGKLPYRTDDHSSVKTNAASATPLVITATAISGTGIVERTTDVDVFRFDLTGASDVVIDIDPWFTGPNLDILAELYDSAGVLVSSSNPASALDANITQTLGAGTYTLAIDGVGAGTLATGYSDYASLGRFTITGSIRAADPVPGGPFVSALPTLNSATAPSQATFVFSEALDSSTVDLTDLVFTGPSGVSLQGALTGVSFPNSQTVVVDFQTQTAAGGYVLALGPNVRDLAGNAMDQDHDGNLNEVPDDRYSFGFSIAQQPLRGDFNSDLLVDANDIDLLCAVISSGFQTPFFDLTSDGSVSSADMDEMILSVLNTHYGDANLDRNVDGTDYGIWNSNKFQPGGWAQGDFSCDGSVDGSDYGIWNSNKFQTTARPVVVVAEDVRTKGAKGLWAKAIKW